MAKIPVMGLDVLIVGQSTQPCNSSQLEY